MARVSRRQFLVGAGTAAGLVAGAGALAACESGDGSADAARESNFDPKDWASVRAQFPLRKEYRHFSAFVFASHPAPVAAAIARYRHELDRDPVSYLHAAEAERERDVLTEAAQYLKASGDEIALTDSTTMGLGLLYGGLRLRPGQEVLTTEHDFFSTHEALRLKAAASGATVRRVRLYDDPSRATADEVVGRLAAAVRSSTRAIAVTWVHSSTGVRLPIREIADALAQVNTRRDPQDHVLLCVDGVHGLGAIDENVSDLGCDFLVAGTHKWLFGPRGTGIIWGSLPAWDAVDTSIPAFHGPQLFSWIIGDVPGRGSPGRIMTPGGYHSFEHRWALADAFRFHRSIGRDRIAARIGEQAQQLKEGLADIKNVTVQTPRDPALSAGIVCFSMLDHDSEIMVRRLAADFRILASVTPYRLEYIRVGPSMVTGPEDVVELLAAIEKLA